MLRRDPAEQNLSPEELQARREGEYQAKKQEYQPVRIVGLDLPFFDLVSLFVKAAIAVVPAAFILGILWYFVLTILQSMGGST